MPTPIVSDQEMLRAYAQTIKLKDAEIERLKAEVERMSDQAMHFRDMAEKQGYLLARAADALVIELDLESPPHHISLIDELRSEHNPPIESQIAQAHQDYEAFISEPSHLGFNAEAYWMAARGLFNPWLAQIQAEYRKAAQ